MTEVWTVRGGPIGGRAEWGYGYRNGLLGTKRLDAFAAFNVVPKNNRKAWSARNEADNIVVIT
jgi:hypothetical protein